MSLNQVELNEIVLDELNRYYTMCSVPPVQHHFDEWIKEAAAEQLKEVFAIDTAERCFKQVWSFKHWYMQKYFGVHVDELMKLTLQPDAFRYYVLRYRNDEGRPAPVKYTGAKSDQEPNIETSEPSNLENSTRKQETGQFSTISPADGVTDHQAPGADHQAPGADHQAPGADHQAPAPGSTAEMLQQCFPGIVMNDALKNYPGAADHQAPGEDLPAERSSE